MSNSFLLANANAESGGNFGIGYHNRARSSAAGAFGITDPTWNGLASKYPNLGLNASNRFDPEANVRAENALVGEWSDHLRNQNLPVNNASLGLSSFLGPAAASSFLQADPNESVQSALARSVGSVQAARMIAANPGVLDPSKTVGQVLQFNQNRLGSPNGSRQGNSPANQGNSMPVSDIPDGQQVPPFDPASGPIQSTPVPQMPSSFGTPTSGPVQAPQVDWSGHEGDRLIADGLAQQSGNSWQEAAAARLGALQKQQSVELSNAQKNAELQNSTNELNSTADSRAAQAAASRVQAWKALNPTVSPDQALNANIQVRGQDIGQNESQARLAVAKMQLQQQLLALKGAPQGYIVPGEDGSPQSNIEVSNTQSGPVIRDLNSGAVLQNLPQGAIPTMQYNQQVAREGKQSAASAKGVDALYASGQEADNQLETLKRVKADVSNPNALNGPGAFNAFGRAFDSLTGSSTFGDKSAEDVSKMDLGQLNWNGIRANTKGLRLTQQEASYLQNNFPNIKSNPEARDQILGVMTHALQRQSDIAKEFSALPDPARAAILRSPGGLSTWQYGENQKLAAANPYVSPSQTPQAASLGGAKVRTITSDDDYNSLPSGTVFVSPDGKTRRKP